MVLIRVYNMRACHTKTAKNCTRNARSLRIHLTSVLQLWYGSMGLLHCLQLGSDKAERRRVRSCGMHSRMQERESSSLRKRNSSFQQIGPGHNREMVRLSETWTTTANRWNSPSSVSKWKEKPPRSRCTWKEMMTSQMRTWSCSRVTSKWVSVEDLVGHLAPNSFSGGTVMTFYGTTRQTPLKSVHKLIFSWID